MDTCHAIVFTSHAHPPRPERGPLRQFSLDANEIGRVLLDEQRAIDQHHVLAAGPHVHPHQAARFGAGAEEFVIGRRQRGLRFVRSGLHRHLFRFECRDEHLPLDQCGAFHRRDFETESMNRIERRPCLDSRAHPPASG
jgi:hypothetical protein